MKEIVNMRNLPNVSIFVVHYSKLKDRRVYLEQNLNKNGILGEWVTEENFIDFQNSSFKAPEIFGISAKLIGMDLGVNSRSLVFSRRRARFQGYSLYVRSFFAREGNTLTTGSLPQRKILPKSQLEIQRMHLTALQRGVEKSTKWILVLEDDAIPTLEAWQILDGITQGVVSGNIWMNLNSGAGLKRTSTDPSPNQYGLFRVKPAATKCATAYLVSRNLAIQILALAKIHGIPEWLPIDLVFQAALRKLKAKAYWQEPETFIQGSETGSYQSNLDGRRI